MPSSSALVIVAEFGKTGSLAPGLSGEVVRPGEARRLGLALLRDCVEKAHHCAGFDSFVAYFPSERRGEAEEAIGTRAVWAEPTAGGTAGERLESFLRHLIGERTYRQAVALFPLYPTVPRQRIFEVVHALRARAGFAVGSSPQGAVGMLGVRELLPPGIAQALGSAAPANEVAAAALRAGRQPEAFPLPAPVDSEDELARCVFDLRAQIATGKVAGDDLPLHTLELVEALGLDVTLKGDGTVELRRAGPPRKPRG